MAVRRGGARACAYTSVATRTSIELCNRSRICTPCLSLDAKARFVASSSRRARAPRTRARLARFPSTPLARFRAFARACTRCSYPSYHETCLPSSLTKRRIVVSSSSRTGVVARRASAGVLKTPKTLRVREVRVYIGWLMRAPRRQCATITTTARRR